MTKLERYALLFFTLIVGLAVYLDKCSPKPPVIEIKELADTNAYYDNQEAEMFKLTEMYEDSLKRIKSRLKAAESKYKLLSVTSVVKGQTKVRVDTVDYECCEQIPYANKIIATQDSIIKVGKVAQSVCNERVVNLKKQVAYDTSFANDLIKENIKAGAKLERSRRVSKSLGIGALILLVSFIIKK